MLDELQKIKPFENPQAKLEQHSTPPTIAKKILEDYKDDIRGSRVLDLGAGTGMLGIACLLQGAEHTTFIEADKKAVEILKENLKTLNIPQERYTIINKELEYTDCEADLIVMNPPFGTRRAHADKAFLDYAIMHAPLTITMHKTSTKEHLKQHLKTLRATITREEDITYPLEKTMSHQTRTQKTIEVTILAITR